MAKYGVATISPSTTGGGVRTCAADLSRAGHQSVFDAAMAPAQESGLRENCTSRLSERAEAERTLDLSRLYSDEAGVMPVERRERVIAIDQVNCGRVTGRRKSLMINGRRQSSCDGTSRMNREVHVRFCERLGVQFPGPTRHSRHSRHPGVSGSPQEPTFGQCTRL